MIHVTTPSSTTPYTRARVCVCTWASCEHQRSPGVTTFNGLWTMNKFTAMSLADQPAGFTGNLKSAFFDQLQRSSTSYKPVILSPVKKIRFWRMKTFSFLKLVNEGLVLSLWKLQSKKVMLLSSSQANWKNPEGLAFPPAAPAEVSPTSEGLVLLDPRSFWFLCTFNSLMGF